MVSIQKDFEEKKSKKQTNKTYKYARYHLNEGTNN